MRSRQHFGLFTKIAWLGNAEKPKISFPLRNSLFRSVCVYILASNIATRSHTTPGGGGGHYLIWPIRGRAAGQGMVFGLLCPEQGILFYANLS